MSDLDKINSKTQQVNKVEKCESLDEGTFAFLNWMNCKSFVGDNCELDPPLSFPPLRRDCRVLFFGRETNHLVRKSGPLRLREHSLAGSS